MTREQFTEKAFLKIQEWVKTIACPLCLGIDSMMHTHASLGPFTGRFCLPDGLECNKAGHKLSGVGFNNPEYAFISLMSESVRPSQENPDGDTA
jgi:hypothetical protein